MKITDVTVTLFARDGNSLDILANLHVLMAIPNSFGPSV